MKQIMIFCCFLSLFVSSIGRTANCDNSKKNCEDDKCTDEKYEDNDYKQRVILTWLYGLRTEIVDGKKAVDENLDDKIKYDYNYYGCSCDYGFEPKDKTKPVKCVYNGGHAGWDVRTRYEDDSSLEKHDFFCITPGIVLADGKLKDGTIPECGKVKQSTHNNGIVIYDQRTGYAIHYLHASKVDYENVQKGKYVPFGRRLGKQGNCGNSGGEHIHIEVRKISYLGPAILHKDLTAGLIDHLVESSHGTNDEKRETIDPIPYLYESVTRSSLIRTLPEIWARCKMMHEDH